ncbi:MAG: hypothetical protein II319_05105 [Clostridia bacterium]|nr:hypothetical protein [Clostridia bacterium]
MIDIFAGIIQIILPLGFIGIFIFAGIKDYRNRNKAEKQSLIDQIEQCKNTIRENEAKFEAKLNEYERKRISRDIKLALGYTNDFLINAVMEYCPGKLMSVHSLIEMKRDIEEAKDDYFFDNFLNEKYLPIIGKEDYWKYHSELLQLKSIIRLHKDLTPQEVIGQIDFYWQNNRRNINEVELLHCIKSANLHLFEFEVSDIAKLIAERFDLCITEGGIENILHPSDHSSSYGEISRLFARVLFESEKVNFQLSALDDNVFISTIEKYFFYKVCYDLKDLKAYLPEIINYVKEHRTFVSNI